MTVGRQVCDMVLPLRVLLLFQGTWVWSEPPHQGRSQPPFTSRYGGSRILFCPSRVPAHMWHMFTGCSLCDAESSVGFSGLHSLWDTISFVLSCGSCNTWAVGPPQMVKKRRRCITCLALWLNKEVKHDISAHIFLFSRAQVFACLLFYLNHTGTLQLIVYEHGKEDNKLIFPSTEH